NVEMNLQRVARIHVLVIAALPAKRLTAFFRRQAGGVDPPIGENFAVCIREVLANDRHQARPGKEARRIREKSCRAAQDVVYSACWRFDGVKCHRADYEQRQANSSVIGERKSSILCLFRSLLFARRALPRSALDEGDGNALLHSLAMLVDDLALPR